MKDAKHFSVKLKINNFYKKLLSGKDANSDKARDYIQEKMRSAVWLIKSIYHLQSTIVNVMESIIKFQNDFFKYGEGHLRPLVLREVAEDIKLMSQTDGLLPEEYQAGILTYAGAK